MKDSHFDNRTDLENKATPNRGADVPGSSEALDKNRAEEKNNQNEFYPPQNNSPSYVVTKDVPDELKDKYDLANGSHLYIFGCLDVNFFILLGLIIFCDLMVFIGSCVGQGKDADAKGKINAFYEIQATCLAFAIIDLIFDVFRALAKTVEVLKYRNDYVKMFIKIAVWTLCDLLQWIFMIVIAVKTNQNKHDFKGIDKKNVSHYSTLKFTTAFSIIGLIIVFVHFALNVYRCVMVGQGTFNGKEVPVEIPQAKIDQYKKGPQRSFDVNVA